MSDFKIVKCKSCDASLVEMQGEKLKKCVQCGYNFNQIIKKKSNLESIFEQAFAKQTTQNSQSTTINSTLNVNPTAKPGLKAKLESQFESISESLTDTIAKPTTTKKSQKKYVKPKESASIIGTIIKWYIIIFILSKVLKGFF